MKAVPLMTAGFAAAAIVCAGIVASVMFASHSNVSAKSSTAPTPQVSVANAALDSIVSSVGAKYGNQVGIVVYDTSTDHTASTNASGQFVSASLYKLFVAYGILRAEDAGTISDSSVLPSLGESINTCLNKMITISDNDCGKALGTLLGWESLDSELAVQGYTSTMLNNYDSDGNLSGDKQTTAADVALLLKRLYAGTLLNQSSNARFLSLLASQEINTYLPSGFPADTKIAHKTGTLYGYVHDAGIVYGSNKNLIVAFMSGQWADPDSQAIPVFTAFGQSLETYLTTY